MSEQKTAQASGETGSGDARPAVVSNPSDAVSAATPDSARGALHEPTQESIQESTTIESPALAPGSEAAQTSGMDMPRVEAPMPDNAKPDARRVPGKLMIMSSDDRAWDNTAAGTEAPTGQSSGMFGNRRLSAMAAVVVLAIAAGALGGALTTAGFGHIVAEDATTAGNRALEASVARIDADILALKAGLEHASKISTTQFSKTSDRLDKVEKAQQEPAAKLAKLSDAVDKLRGAAPAAPAAAAATPVAVKEVTGSISPPPAATPATAPKVEVARLPTVEGWALRDVANGGALIEGRQGIYEVYAGDPVPGLGRVDAIRRQDGRWVVVTSKGLIVAR